jgi:thiamine pyrophosphate-dependent acetolactate synthase large subunit-like protein
MTERTLDRRQVVRDLLAERGELLLVAGLGGTNWDVTNAGDHPLNFHLWGAMGSAAMIGLGLALARPERRVLVITGDGEMLMGLGALATIAVQAPSNLSLVVIDNELYGETGRQPTHTAHGADLAGIARAAGIAESETITQTAGVHALKARIMQSPGPRFACIKVAQEVLPMVLPERDGVRIKDRFRHAVLEG